MRTMGVHTHVKTTSNTGTLQGLVTSVSAADGHETRHLNLGELNLAAAEGSQRLDRNQSAMGIRSRNC